MRKRQRSSIEVAIQRVLKTLKIEYLPQHRIGKDAVGGFIVDFYIPSKKLILECDGNFWHNLPDRQLRDTRLDKWAEMNHYKILHLQEEEIRVGPKKCLLKGLVGLGLNSKP